MKKKECFWKVLPSPTSRARNIICAICKRPKHSRQECVYCTTVKWMQAQGLPLPVVGVDGDSHGRATRQLNRMVGVSN